MLTKASLKTPSAPRNTMGFIGRVLLSLLIATGVVLGYKTWQRDREAKHTANALNADGSANSGVTGGANSSATGTGATSSTNGSTSGSTAGSVPSAPLPPGAWAAKFDANQAYAYTEKQVSFGPRVPGTDAHKKTGDYLIQTLKSFGAQVLEQPFSAPVYAGVKKGDDVSKAEPIASRNIIASFSPENPHRVLLAAHWDTRAAADKDLGDSVHPADGANDGASGVAVLLEIGRTLAQNAKSLPVGVDFILFDNEDQGVMGNPAGIADPGATWCSGSQYWAKNPHAAGYRADWGILLDMVGAKGSSFPREMNSLVYAATPLTKVWETARKLGHGQYFTDLEAPGIVDDHVFMNRAGIPTLDIIDMDANGASLFREYHHTRADSMKIIDKDVLRAVGQTVLESLAVVGASAPSQSAR